MIKTAQEKEVMVGSFLESITKEAMPGRTKMLLALLAGAGGTAALNQPGVQESIANVLSGMMPDTQNPALDETLRHHEIPFGA